MLRIRCVNFLVLSDTQVSRMATTYFWCCGGFSLLFFKQISVKRRRMWDPSVLPIQAEFPLSTPEHQPQFCLYPDSWLTLAVFQKFWLTEGLTSLPVIPVEACYLLQKVFSWPLRTASCWIADLHCLNLPVAGTSQKRWWACTEHFEDMCWGILGTPTSPAPDPPKVMSDFWETHCCCVPCSGKPGRLATWDRGVQIANITHFLSFQQESNVCQSCLCN